ncbi:hypothetical protein EGC86_03870 [Shewanella frigidimarina]|uniref:hypothetical protein n=1 Tax=Shewanella frigidimarina TaxID=56812 RepID=UPI000F4EA7EA|nr:hypothetical protein [Shewanella frigidimarina]RPA64413.1 hypothetical protein EGC86_03870 [Shewanella frigidimarina]
MSNFFIAETFEPPKNFDNEYFHFRVLEDEVAKLDFEAVISSQKRLYGIFGSDSEWPQSDMKLEENITSLKVHKHEFESRQAFAYSVFNQSKNKCLGSVYIDPSPSPNYQCVVYLWVRDDSIELDNELYRTVCKWLSKEWSFSKIAFPGRCILWKDWDTELSVVQQVN